MSERKEGSGGLDSGRHPENRSSKETFKACPCCERKFDKLKDFPRVYVEKVDTTGPNDVPPILPHWLIEKILPSPKPGDKTPVVPEEVAEHFQADPGSTRLFVYGDYVYARPPNKRPGYAQRHSWHDTDKRIFGGSDMYERAVNWAQPVRDLFEEDHGLVEYFDRLKSLQGQEVRTADIFPVGWDTFNSGGIVPEAEGLVVPGDPRFHLRIMGYDVDSVAYNGPKTQNNPDGLRYVKMVLCVRGPNSRNGGEYSYHEVFDAGEIAYEGRVNT